jgi:hypothetical protein
MTVHEPDETRSKINATHCGRLPNLWQSSHWPSEGVTVGARRF